MIILCHIIFRSFSSNWHQFLNLRAFWSIHAFVNLLNILNCSSLKIVCFFCLRSSFIFFIHLGSLDWTIVSIILKWFIRRTSLLVKNRISKFSWWKQLTWNISYIDCYLVILFWVYIICIFRFKWSINMILSPLYNPYIIFIQKTLWLQRILSLTNFNNLFMIS